MRIKDGFELREICGEHVILSHGMDNIDFSKIISLNETAAFLWKEAVGKEEISEEFQHEYMELSERYALPESKHTGKKEKIAKTEKMEARKDSGK